MNKSQRRETSLDTLFDAVDVAMARLSENANAPHRRDAAEILQELGLENARGYARNGNGMSCVLA